MNHQERTGDVYEWVGGYQKPPLIPLLALDDLELQGLKSSRFSRFILKTALVLATWWGDIWSRCGPSFRSTMTPIK